MKILFSILLMVVFYFELQASNLDSCKPLFFNTQVSALDWIKDFEVQGQKRQQKIDSITSYIHSSAPFNIPLSEAIEISLYSADQRLEGVKCHLCREFEAEIFSLKQPEQIIQLAIKQLNVLKYIFKDSKDILKNSPFARFLESFLVTFIPYSFNGFITYNEYPILFQLILDNPLDFPKAVLLKTAWISDQDLPMIINIALDPKQKKLRTFIAGELMPSFTPSAQLKLKKMLWLSASPLEKEQFTYLFSKKSS
ncbi:MAG TPA: hypothetical protein PLJ21_12650 [Pseudobdellovibrionaceae bacterium]|nr:hypothetical protein [Pseudobdellovibrionaceae bacterium]